MFQHVRNVIRRHISLSVRDFFFLPPPLQSCARQGRLIGPSERSCYICSLAFMFWTDESITVTFFSCLRMRNNEEGQLMQNFFFFFKCGDLIIQNLNEATNLSRALWEGPAELGPCL